MSARILLCFLVSAGIGFALGGCASSKQSSTQTAGQREEARRHAVRIVTTVGHPITRPSGSDQ